MRTFVETAAALASFATIALGASQAQAAAAMPAAHPFGKAGEYLSGGVGQGEAKAVQADSKNWPLTLEFVVQTHPRAEFVSDVHVLVKDAKGHAEFTTVADGPFLLAKLPPGRYLVDATLSGKTLHRSVVLKSHVPTKMVFEWPGGTHA